MIYLKGLYVSLEEGSDANAGTKEKPFKTIAHAINVFDSDTYECIYVIGKQS